MADDRRRRLDVEAADLADTDHREVDAAGAVDRHGRDGALALARAGHRAVVGVDARRDEHVGGLVAAALLQLTLAVDDDVERTLLPRALTADGEGGCGRAGGAGSIERADECGTGDGEAAGHAQGAAGTGAVHGSAPS